MIENKQTKYLDSNRRFYLIIGKTLWKVWHPWVMDRFAHFYLNVFVSLCGYQGSSISLLE